MRIRLAAFEATTRARAVRRGGTPEGGGGMSPTVYRDGKRIDGEVRRSYRKLVELTEDPVALREIAIQAFGDWRLSRKEAERIAAIAIPKERLPRTVLAVSQGEPCWTLLEVLATPHLRFELGKRSRGRRISLARAFPSGKNKGTIRLNPYLLEWWAKGRLNTEAVLKLILHELAHLQVPKGTHHGPAWIERAKALGAPYSYTSAGGVNGSEAITAITKFPEYGMEDATEEAKLVRSVRLGYEVPSGEPVDIPLHHVVVTGLTQLSGKTTEMSPWSSPRIR